MSGLINPRVAFRLVQFCRISLMAGILILLQSGLAAADEPVEIAVEGVEGELLSNVVNALRLPPGVVTDGTVNEPWLQRFEEQIPDRTRKALEPFGYYAPEVTAKRDRQSGDVFRIQVVVDPGRPVLVTAVSVSVEGPGADVGNLREMAAAFPLQQGMVLRHDLYEAGKNALKSRAIELGYLDADFATHEIRVLLEQHTASVEVLLNTGPRYLFGEVSFEGAESYPRSFLRRYLAFRTGEVFSHAKLSASQLNLVNSDRFAGVLVAPEKGGASGLNVPIKITLTPSPPKRLRMGVGYGTDTGARASLQYADVNVFGSGHGLKAELSLSERLQGLAAGYIIPGSDIDSFSGVEMSMRREEVDTYRTQLFSVEVNRTRSLGRGRLGTAYLRLQQEDSTVGNATLNQFLVLPGLRFTGRRFDNLLRPQNGYRYSLELRGSDRALGSDVSLLQFMAEAGTVIPLSGRLSLMARVNTAVTLQRGRVRDLPATLRYFAGGDRSVRGYAYQSLGPKDRDGNVIGGRHLLTGSIEIERAIGRDWGVAAFYDIGNAFNASRNITLAQGAGIGVRYYSKIGAIRVDVARQVGVKDPQFRLHVTLGVQL